MKKYTYANILNYLAITAIILSTNYQNGWSIIESIPYIWPQFIQFLVLLLLLLAEEDIIDKLSTITKDVEVVYGLLTSILLFISAILIF